METNERSKLILNRLGECLFNGEITTEDQKEMILLLSDYLGLKTLTHKASSDGVSYQAVRKRHYDFIQISEVKFIIDNL